MDAEVEEGWAIRNRPFNRNRDVAALIEQGQFTLPVAHVLPLSQVAEAQRLSESGHPGGKIVLTVD